MATPEDDVREASVKFYAALNRMANGDAGPMAERWSWNADVTALHPIGGREVGWGKVGTSFDQVAQAASEGRIRLDDQLIRVAGELAYEVGVERGSLALAGRHAELDQRVTNIYRKEAGKWKVVHHHTDLSPAMMAILKELQAKA